MDLLERALADLAVWPNSSAAAIAARIGQDGPHHGHAITSRDVFNVLDEAAYQGTVQRHQVGAGTAWLWQIPGQDYEARGPLS